MKQYLNEKTTVHNALLQAPHPIPTKEQIKEWTYVQDHYPNAIILMCLDNFYITYNQCHSLNSELSKIEYTQTNTPWGLCFPSYTMETVLKLIIKSGHQVTIFYPTDPGRIPK